MLFFYLPIFPFEKFFLITLSESTVVLEKVRSDVEPIKKIQLLHAKALFKLSTRIEIEIKAIEKYLDLKWIYAGIEKLNTRERELWIAQICATDKFVS